jgi:hypothetical protein
MPTFLWIIIALAVIVTAAFVVPRAIDEHRRNKAAKLRAQRQTQWDQEKRQRNGGRNMP